MEHEDLTQSLNLVKDVIAAVNSKVSNYEKKMRLGEIYNRTDSKSIMRMKSGQMFAREDLRHRKLIRDGPVSLKSAAGRLKGKTVLPSVRRGYSLPSLDVGSVLRVVSPASIYPSALGDFASSFPCAVHSFPNTALPTPHVLSGGIGSCFSPWRLVCLLKAWVAVTSRCISQGAELLGDPLGPENTMGLQLPRVVSQISASCTVNVFLYCFEFVIR